jgi:N-acetylmuramoyl-L-alanine amidase CwlA
MRVVKNYISNTKWGRPGITRDKTLWIDIHDPGAVTTADALWKYIEEDKTRYKSYNTIIGNGKIMELMPNDEVSYSNGHLSNRTQYMLDRFPEISATGKQNWYSFGVCIIRQDSYGTIAQEDWDNAVWYIRAKMDLYHLTPLDIIPHYNICTHKVDPLLFYNDRSELDRFRWEVSIAGK